MDKILIFLLLIIFILVILNITNDIETFDNNETPKCENKDDKCKPITPTKNSYKNILSFDFSEIKDQIPCRCSIINDYFTFENKNTISLLFKLDENENEAKQHLISLKDEWYIYIDYEYYKLIFKDYDNKNTIEVDLNESKPNTSKTNIDELIDSENKSNKYKHLAIISIRENDSSKVIKLFLNGYQGLIKINSKENKTSNDLFIGYNNDNKIIESNSNFKGSILDLNFYNKVMLESELCSMWNSCGIFECSYNEATDPTETREQCEENCNNVDDCLIRHCKNKCYDTNISKWKPPCKFVSNSSNVKRCTDQCFSDINCRFDECAKICKDKEEQIELDNKEKYNQDYSYKINQLTCKKVAPPILHLSVSKNKEITIEWEPPYKIEYNSKNNEFNYSLIDGSSKYKYDEEVDMFIFMMSKTDQTDKKKEGTKIFTFTPNIEDLNKTTNYNNNIENIISYKKEISDLDEAEYSIICKSVKLNKGSCNKNMTTTSPSNSDNDPEHTISDNSYIYTIKPILKTSLDF